MPSYLVQIRRDERECSVEERPFMAALAQAEDSSLATIIDSGGEKMDSAGESEERFNQILHRAVASRKRRRQMT